VELYVGFPTCSHILTLTIAFGRPFVLYTTVRPMLSVCCLSVCVSLCMSACPVCPVWSVCDVDVLWPNGWMNQDETWHGSRPRRLGPGHIVLDGDPAPSPEEHSPSPNFRPMSVFAKRLAGSRCHLLWRYISAHRPQCHNVLCGNPAPLPQKGAQPPNFRPMSIVAKRLSGSGCHLVRMKASAQATLC